ncbi:hypothetical protein GDO78_013848 [Eleutherodactylus coqui]|uniref:Uncharacterized protein n=1 Tax=Eleutherodactylus coqui TaxID=57060 RepID=A0A8J6EF75_ELECQ|nr:hypothetical protein GDO78_013848 [Eleutherodactylus coqui]
MRKKNNRNITNKQILRMRRLLEPIHHLEQEQERQLYPYRTLYRTADHTQDSTSPSTSLPQAIADRRPVPTSEVQDERVPSTNQQDSQKMTTTNKENKKSLKQYGRTGNVITWRVIPEGAPLARANAED